MRGVLAAAAVVALAAAPAALPAASPPAQGVIHVAGSSFVGTKNPRVARGASLYAANCSTCHGSAGKGISPPRSTGAGGVTQGGPSLRRVGALSADFYLRTGKMPLKDPSAEPQKSPVLFTEGEIRAMVAYIATLGKGPPIPHPRPAQGNLADGMRLFTNHCAGCHQIAGAGGYVTDARVPPLGDSTPTEVAEAVRIGPYLMPHYPPHEISPRQLNDIVAYVVYTQHPQDPGGWPIGHLGPWPEGVVTWLIASVVLVVGCLAFARRLRRA
jgi:ubiquinol-cytochrome c reductase cytochrome c subunit